MPHWCSIVPIYEVGLASRDETSLTPVLPANFNYWGGNTTDAVLARIYDIRQADYYVGLVHFTTFYSDPPNANPRNLTASFLSTNIIAFPTVWSSDTTAKEVVVLPGASLLVTAGVTVEVENFFASFGTIICFLVLLTSKYVTFQGSSSLPIDIIFGAFSELLVLSGQASFSDCNFTSGKDAKT